MSVYSIFFIGTLITGLILLSIFKYHVFPVSYIEGTGLTPFKIYSEYLISGLFALSAIFTHRFKDRFEPKVYSLLFSAFILNICAELLFTLYVGVYDIFNLLGHIIVFVTYYLVYKAIIEVGLTKPYNLLFRELEKISQQKDDFMHIISHEIRNPLTVIRLAVNSAAKSKHLSADLHMIDSEVNKINNLITDLLDTARIESGQFSYSPTNINFSDFISQLIKNCQKLTTKHTIVLRLPKKNVTILGDQNRLNQVFTNLLTNAIKYSPQKGNIKVYLKTDKKYLHIGVTDHGIGIPKNHQSHIFDKYFRTKNGHEDIQSANSLQVGSTIQDLIAWW